MNATQIRHNSYLLIRVRNLYTYFEQHLAGCKNSKFQHIFLVFLFLLEWISFLNASQFRWNGFCFSTSSPSSNITQFEHIISYITCIERKTKNVLRWKWFLEFYSNIWQYINCTLCKYILNILDIWKCNLFSVKMALLPFTWFLFFGWKRMKASSLMVGITRLRYRSIHPSCCQLFSINVAGRINSIIHLAVMDVRTLFLFCSLLLFFFSHFYWTRLCNSDCILLRP